VISGVHAAGNKTILPIPETLKLRCYQQPLTPSGNFAHYVLNISKYMELIFGQSAVRMPVQAIHHERFSKHFLQFFSIWSLHNKSLLVINRLKKNFRLNPCKFQKVVF
jgi:hypothetical protein